MRYMLDTNICLYLMRRHPPEVVARFAGLGYGDVVMSSITLAELRFGALRVIPRFRIRYAWWRRESESDSKSIIQSQIEEVNALKSLIGRDETVVDVLVTKAKEEITKRSGAGASVELTLDGALVKVATDRGVQEYSSSDRMAQLQAKITEYDLRVKSHEVALGSMKDSLTA